MSQRPRPLKPDVEGRNLRKEANVLELEVDPRSSEVEVKLGRAVWKHKTWC